MPSDSRILIDFATGENWRMPADLYEKYERFYEAREALNKPVESGLTTIQYWFTTLTQNEKEQITKK